MKFWQLYDNLQYGVLCELSQLIMIRVLRYWAQFKSVHEAQAWDTLNATYVAHEHLIRNGSEQRKYYELEGSFLGQCHKKHNFKYHSQKIKKILNTEPHYCSKISANRNIKA
jgi:hypothetical protein